ncbi:hypothetical protein KC207_11640 [Phycicoccus sp. BSK3Z-2]|uniref:Uncharacterized protein n=1 Tax=Phycicoccus avicenniae TaxID=2828860 RepID=A0A941D9T6_9MICO|nr:hypothetical protein [Phycicoccus avicenniae]MBR7743460.1 hypothetical protein [Phycicoccus avicenniae]MBR7743944.1 hypothetical protein [Phycicoccus avicenniae]
MTRSVSVGAPLTRTGLAAGLWLAGTSVAAGLLAWVGWWTPWVAWPVGLLVLVAAAVAVRGLPGVALGRGPAAGLVVVCLGFAGYAAATHSEHVMPRRDAASNLQAAVSLAATGERVVPVDVSVFGGPDLLRSGDLTLASAAFYQVGSAADPAIQPQFLMAPATVYGYGVLAGGPEAAMLLPAVAMALVLMLLGLLAAHLTRPWWGVAAAGLTGLLFPVLNVARGTYSEQLALLTLVGGLLALVLAAGRDGGDRTAGRLALVGGLLVGGTGVARVDALREVMLLLPVLAVAVALGRAWARPALAGLVASTVVAYGLGWGLSFRYLGDIHASLLPLVAMVVVVAAVSGAGVRLWRRGRRLPAGLVRRAPDVVAGLTVLAGLVLWSRPWWLTVRQDPDDPGARYVAGMQRRQGLPVDGGRTYAEHTVDWLSWYVGWAALVVALLALALVLRAMLTRLADGDLVPWAAPLVLAAGSTLLTLLRPGITPDHPWADRRLLVALPFVVLLVVVAGRWAGDRVAREGRPWARPLVAAVVVLGLGVPAGLASWPFRGVGVERGSLAAVDEVCAVLDPDDVVLGIDGRASSEWPQVVRGMCGTPFAVATTPVREDPERLRAVVDEVARGAAAQGRSLVVLAADGPEAVEEIGLDPREVVDIRFPEEEHALDRPPRRFDVGGIRVSVADVPAG